MKFHVPDMSCGHCTAAIEKALKTIDPDARVDTDLTSKTVTIASDRKSTTSENRHDCVRQGRRCATDRPQGSRLPRNSGLMASM